MQEGKTKHLSLHLRHWTFPIYINGRHIEFVDQFVYYDSIISDDSGIEVNITRRISNTSSTIVLLEI